MAVTVVFLSGKRAGESVSVDTDMLIGREDADIVVDDTEVSRQHAVLRVSETGAQIEDLGSRNGTFINGERTAAARELADDDEIRLGQTEFRVSVARVPGETRISAVPQQTVLAARPEPSQPEPPAALEAPPAPPPAAAPGPSPSVPRGAAAAGSAVPRRSSPRVASRQTPAAVAAFAIIIATGVGLILYFAAA